MLFYGLTDGSPTSVKVTVRIMYPLFLWPLFTIFYFAR